MEQMDLIQAPITDLPPDSLDAFELTLDLGPLSLDDHVEETFDDLIRQEKYRSGSLVPLRKCRHLLRDGGTLRLVNLYQGATEEGYASLVEILLRTAGFVEARMVSAAPPVTVEARKRTPVVEEQEFGMMARELVGPAELEQAHEFARSYYFFKDFNYDLDVARQFDLHTDVFGIFDKNAQMIALARVAMRVPGYNCPFMYALTDAGTHFHIPNGHRCIGEVMAISKEGREGAVAFKRLMEFLVYHVPLIAHPDSMWTTFEAEDPYTGNLYKNKFLMEDIGIRLTYRDFGGKWNLLCTSKIQELHKLHHELFRR